MERTVWKPVKQVYCEHVGEEVTLEAKIVYPAELMPDQAPRVLAHRCSLGIECNLVDKPACRWAGTNPDYDPFSE